MTTEISIPPLVEEDLPIAVDCVSWHPRQTSLLAIGAYQLDKADNTIRHGRIYLVKLTKTVPGGYKVVTEYETRGGVLDLKWEDTQDYAEGLLSVATSNGIYFLKLVIQCQEEEDNFILELLGEIELPNKNMALYLQWINQGKNVIFSDSEGKVNLVSVDLVGLGFQIIQSKQVHDALTWVVHYSEDQDVVYSGCDDGKFTAFTLKNIEREMTHLVKQFPMGVTSITSRNELVAVGSYDEILRIYELTTTTPKPILLQKTEVNLSGAVWRTMWLPNLKSPKDSHLMVVACARKGLKIIEINSEAKDVSILHEYTKYEGSLAYGLDVKVDWRDPAYVIASCYFDNKIFHIFKWAPNVL